MLRHLPELEWHDGKHDGRGGRGPKWIADEPGVKTIHPRACSTVGRAASEEDVNRPAIHRQRTTIVVAADRGTGRSRVVRRWITSSTAAGKVKEAQREREGRRSSARRRTGASTGPLRE